MALNQLRAVTNRRIKPNIVAGINAQTPYLPQLYQQKENDAYQTKLFDQNERSMGINERGLAQSGEIAKRNEALAYKQLEEQKDQNKTAKKLGYANMGVGGLTGLAGLYQSSKPLDGFDITPSLSDVTQNAVSGVADMGDFAAFSDSFQVPSFSGGGMGPAGTPGAAGMGYGLADSGDFFGGVGDFVMDYAVEPLKQIGGSIWDAGSSFLNEIGDMFS